LFETEKIVLHFLVSKAWMVLARIFLPLHRYFARLIGVLYFRMPFLTKLQRLSKNRTQDISLRFRHVNDAID